MFMPSMKIIENALSTSNKLSGLHFFICIMIKQIYNVVGFEHSLG